MATGPKTRQTRNTRIDVRAGGRVRNCDKANLSINAGNRSTDAKPSHHLPSGVSRACCAGAGIWTASCQVAGPRLARWGLGAQRDCLVADLGIRKFDAIVLDIVPARRPVFRQPGSLEQQPVSGHGSGRLLLGSAQNPFLSSIERWTRKNDVGPDRPKCCAGRHSHPNRLFLEEVTMIPADLPSDTDRISAGGSVPQGSGCAARCAPLSRYRGHRQTGKRE